MILIVDDKSENIFALKKLLEVNNFDVDTALSGEEALKKVLKNSYALIILDVQMPGMDGFEVAEAISGYSKGKDIPIIFLSAANTDKKFIIKGYSSGGIDYVAKPVDPEILLLKVRTFYRLSEQTRELNEIHSALRAEMEIRKKAQFEQHRKTKELKSILETIPQITFTASQDGNIEYVNEQWYVYSDLKNVFPEVYNKDVPVSGFWENIIASPPQLPLEVCIKKRHNNECRFHLLTLIPVKEEQEIRKWVGTFTDIHEQKLAKDLLEKRVEGRTAELIVANEELVFQNEEKEKRAAELIIANKELVFQNEEKEKRADEMIMANLQLAAQSKEREKRADELIIANLQLATQSKEKEKRAAELVIANKELAFQNNEKENRAAELVIANKELAFQNDEKEKRAAELKQVDEERTKLMTDIVQRNKDLEQFSYIISHNLRAPVANIIGLTDIVNLSGFDLKNDAALMNDLGVSVKKLDGVIRDLNYILQIKHKESRKKEPVEFSGILSDIKLSIDSLIKSEEVQIISNFSAVNEMLTLKSYLYSIFMNLITNSIKYRQPEMKPVIEIYSAQLNNKIQVFFKDNGLGIDLKKRGEQVFGLYKRFHDHVDGKGMGLYMVKTQVESLDGKISISSEVNKGTEFLIEFENEFKTNAFC